MKYQPVGIYNHTLLAECYTLLAASYIFGIACGPAKNEDSKKMATRIFTVLSKTKLLAILKRKLVFE